MNRKKELKELYKNIKSDMGIFSIESKLSNKCFIQTTHDLKGTMNSTVFQLDFGNYNNIELQKEWSEAGAKEFEIKILERLEYDKDESKNDYSTELEIMRFLWEEKLAEQGTIFYK